MCHNNNPLVSVITPTYKRPEKLPRAIDSVLNQTYPNVEIIVVDDNNPDTEGRKLTEEIMAEYEDNPRVKYIKHEKNKNGSAARNTGARNSSAKYLAFLDDDDEFLPTKIEAQVNALESRSDEWALCYTKYFNKKPNCKPVVSTECREGNLYKEALMQKICIAGGSNLFVRKTAFDEVGGFNELFLRNQDHEFLVKLLRRYKIAFVDVPGLIVYVHDDPPTVDYETVVERYLDSFSEYINTLSATEQRELHRSLNETRFIHFLTDKKDFKSALKLVFYNEVSVIGICKRICESLIINLKGRL